MYVQQRDLPSIKSTPLLLAASSGGLSAVQVLIELGAMVRSKDAEGNDLVTLAALRFHTNVLEYLIHMASRDAPVWDVLVGQSVGITVFHDYRISNISDELIYITKFVSYHVKSNLRNLVFHALNSTYVNMCSLVNIHNHQISHKYSCILNELLNIILYISDMLNNDNMAKKDSAVKCLEVLSTSKPDHWQCILEAGSLTSLTEKKLCQTIFSFMIEVLKMFSSNREKSKERNVF